VVIYPDTSFLFSLYVDEETSATAAAYAQQLNEAVAFTPFHRLELRTALRARAFRGELSLDSLTKALRDNEEDVAQGVLEHTPLNWTDTLREAERVGEAHLTEVGARSGDLLHVASAVVLGAKEFVTFDQRQNALARRAGLKVKTWRLK
jgi:predicted nucleic acid-binding protein